MDEVEIDQLTTGLCKHSYSYEMSHPAFTQSPPERIDALWPVLISRPAEDRRLSWPGWLGEILRWWLARPKTVTRRVLAEAAGK